MNGGEMSGVNLARVALRAAMAQARQNGGGQKAKPRPVRAVRRGGREPMGLGVAIGALVTERAWELPAAGATLRERWAAIAPELAGHVAAVSYDADSGRLTVCPESSAWATKARLEQTRIVAAANESAGRTVVRSLRILAPGAVPVPEPADVDPEPEAAPAGPPRTRETASDGYRRALAAHQEAARPSRVDPHIAEAVEQQSAAMRELSRRAFPELDTVPDDKPARSSRPAPSAAARPTSPTLQPCAGHARSARRGKRGRRLCCRSRRPGCRSRREMCSTALLSCWPGGMRLDCYSSNVLKCLGNWSDSFDRELILTSLKP
ncbi:MULTISPECIES: DciA family protein [unclassified Streptomyces]|uniref:DciA family protein n=1 Tax=unclassified Streptomyces TaxID=2593676 RepID=UPI00290580A0|nr:DciA family protein [Streptomyces sp. PAL114]